MLDVGSHDSALNHIAIRIMPPTVVLEPIGMAPLGTDLAGLPAASAAPGPSER
jgi:hypothetical protein